jgi:Putative auto-transporter adhesin, head GIN domain
VSLRTAQSIPGKLRHAVTALGVVLLLAGCVVDTERSDKEGSGVEAAQTREVDLFDRVSLSGEADVVVTVGEGQTVTVRGDDNLLDDVETDVDDETLEISDREGVNLEPNAGITVEVRVEDLEEIELSGAGNVSAEGIRGDAFRVDVSGAGNVEATGEVDRVDAEMSGAGNIRLAELVAKHAIAEISGAGDIDLYATESLSASVSGAGSIIYTGSPRDVETDVSGVGAIRAG